MPRFLLGDPSHYYHNDAPNNRLIDCKSFVCLLQKQQESPTMGAKKKGGLATRLAKMSDDERAKYLQRKADMEEEARRRKEQLIAGFMKNKLKREDTFSRLNLAKINQQWHQVMRADKCRDMKNEVEHLRRGTDRVLFLKNATIKKLMDELDWQENLYGMNFSAHSQHIDKIIEFHHKNLDQLRKQYENDRKLLLHVGTTERSDYENKMGDEIEYLKSIIYGQEVKAEEKEMKSQEEYTRKMDEILSNYRMELNQMKKDREIISCALWRQISNILRAYVQQTDIRRAHFAELERLDAEGAAAVSANQQIICNEEQQVAKLKDEHAKLVEISEEQVRDLQQAAKVTTKIFFQKRKQLHLGLARDETQLSQLSSVSNRAIDDLEKLAAKGDQILQLVETCRKLETRAQKGSYKEDDLKLIENDIDDKQFIEKDKMAPKPSRILKLRPKTAVSKIQSVHGAIKQTQIEETPVFQISTRLTRTGTAKQSAKPAIPKQKSLPLLLPVKSKILPSRAVSAPKSFSVKKADNFILEASETSNNFDILGKLQGMWWKHNKVEMDCMGLREEKRALLQQNRKLKEIIRDVLEAAAMGQSIPTAKSASSTASRKRFVLSAPFSSYSLL